MFTHYEIYLQALESFAVLSMSHSTQSKAMQSEHRIIRTHINVRNKLAQLLAVRYQDLLQEDAIDLHEAAVLTSKMNNLAKDTTKIVERIHRYEQHINDA